MNDEVRQQHIVSIAVACQRIRERTWVVDTEAGVVLDTFGRVHDGYVCKDGYHRIGTRWCGKAYSIGIHWAVWLAAHGCMLEDPEMEIDHINGNKEDNRLANLRLVTSRENKLNRNAPAGRPCTRRAKKWLTLEEKKGIISLVAEKEYSITKIAEMHGISRQSVSKMYHKYIKTGEIA